MTIKGHFAQEAKRFVVYTLFLTVLFGAFTTYERLILGSYEINYTHYGYAILEAVILVKFIFLGQRFRLGERYHHKSLIIPVLHKALLFCVLVLLFGIAEHLIYGYYQGLTVKASLHIFTHRDLDAVLAKLLIMFFIFMFFFAFLELSRVLGEGQLYKLFFKRTME